MERELAINIGMLYLKMKDEETKIEACDRLMKLLELVEVDWNNLDIAEAEVREI